MNTATFRLSMSKLNKFSPNTSRPPRYIRANESPSPPRSENMDETPLNVSLDDYENIPWIQRHCKRHIKIGIIACIAVFLILSSIVAVVYFNIQPPPGNDEDQILVTSSKWLTIHSYEIELPTSSTLPILSTKVENTATTTIALSVDSSSFKGITANKRPETKSETSTRKLDEIFRTAPLKSYHPQPSDSLNITSV